nr:TRAP transporter substrate-binding protein [Halomonas socia]
MFKRTLALSALTLAVAIGTAQAQETITVAIGGAPQSLQGQTAKGFADRLQERLGDEYKVDYFDSAQLGDERQLVQRMRMGTVDLAAISSIMSSVSPDFALFDLPYLVKDRDHLKRIDQEIVMNDLAESAKEQGLTVVSTWENGFRHITNSTRPIHTPEDLNGLRIRTPQSDWRTRMFSAWGANPTPMAFSEVFVGLQTGVVDGQENPLSNIYGARLHEVQDYLSLSNHVYSPIWLLAGNSGWENFSDEVREAIIEAAAETQDWALNRGAALDEELLMSMQEEGMEVNQVDREAFISGSESVYEAFAERVSGGQALIDRAMALANE